MLAIANENEFNEQINSGKLAVVDFWTTWCHSCKGLEPVLERLAASFKGKAEFIKVDGDENPELVQQLGISGYPTLVLFKDGEVVNKLAGAYPESTIKEIIEGHL